MTLKTEPNEENERRKDYHFTDDLENFAKLWACTITKPEPVTKWCPISKHCSNNSTDENNNTSAEENGSKYLDDYQENRAKGEKEKNRRSIQLEEDGFGERLSSYRYCSPLDENSNNTAEEFAENGYEYVGDKTIRCVDCNTSLPCNTLKDLGKCHHGRCRFMKDEDDETDLDTFEDWEPSLAGTDVYIRDRIPQVNKSNSPTRPQDRPEAVSGFNKDMDIKKLKNKCSNYYWWKLPTRTVHRQADCHDSIAKERRGTQDRLIRDDNVLRDTDDESTFHPVKEAAGKGRLVLFKTKLPDGKASNIYMRTEEHKPVTKEYLLRCLYDANGIETKSRGNVKKTKRILIPKHLIRKEGQSFDEYLRNQEVHMVQDLLTRMGSFNHQWPNEIRTGPFVQAGFSCKDPRTKTVECTACGLEIDATTLTSPLDYHRQRSPDCEFFRDNTVGDTNRVLTDQAPPTQRNNSNEFEIDQAPVSADRRPGGIIGPRPTQNGGPATTRTNSLPEPMLDERRRTGDNRTAESVPNDNNVTSRGEALSRDEHVQEDVGAEGGAGPYSIRNRNYTEEQARRETFRLWPRHGPGDIDLLVTAGFFYTGSEDIVRCFYCDIGLAEWNTEDDPWVEHARHSPECPYLRDQKGQEYINNIQVQWARIYTPKHPEYSQLDARRGTFDNAGWPRDNVYQTPDQLAASGFFYTGESDTVRCHYCDGGLREWEPEDNPWVEHARWFPFCKYVVKIKGIDFIQASATGNPANELGVNVPAARAPQPNQAPLTISFVEECRIKEQRNPMLSAAAQSVRSMGYSRRAIRTVINKFIETTGRRDFKAMELMDILMAMEEDGHDMPQSDDEYEARSISGAAHNLMAPPEEEEMDLTPEALSKENEYLRLKFLCKDCGQRERCIVFGPCGHRITCQECGEKAVTCSHCNTKVEQRYKTFLG